MKQLSMMTGAIEEDLSRVTTAKIGSLDDPDLTVPALLSRLKRYRRLLKYNIFSSRESTTLARVAAAIDNLETDVSDGALRKQPFCVMLYGYPGTGKSSFAIQIARQLMIDLYGKFNTTDMVTLNETDEYQSEFRTSHKVVLFDDIGASSYGLSDTKNPWRKVIDFVNNIKKTALNPNVEMKGKVYIQPDLVILTSNLNFEKGGEISLYIPAYEAIVRRISKFVRVNDHKQVTPLDFAGLGDEGIKSYLTRKPILVPRGGSQDPVSIDRDTYIQELRSCFQEHNQNQHEFIHRFNACFDDMASKNMTPQSGKISSKSKDILVSQSGRIDEALLTRLKEHRVQYLVEHVDWDRFIYDYGCPEDSERIYGDHFHLSPSGIIYRTWLNELDLCVDRTELFEAFLRIKEDYLQFPTIKAESKVIREPKETSLQEYLNFTLPRRLMKMSEAEDALPSEYYQFFARNLRKKTVSTKSFCAAYAVYLCRELDVTISRILEGPGFISSFVGGMAQKNKDKFKARVGRYIEMIKRNSDCGASNLTSATSSFATCEDDLCVSDVEHDSDDPEPSEEGSAASPISQLSDPAMWSCESDQIGHALSLIPLPRCAHPSINVKFGGYGEADLIILSSKSVLVFEMKRGLGTRDVARAQAIRYSRVMRALYPNRRVTGLVHNPLGFTVVCDLGQPVPTDFSQFLKMVGYMDPNVITKD